MKGKKIKSRDWLAVHAHFKGGAGAMKNKKQKRRNKKKELDNFIKES